MDGQRAALVEKNPITMVAADGIAIPFNGDGRSDFGQPAIQRYVSGERNRVGAAAGWAIAFGAVVVGGDDGVRQRTA